jgi:hypothetical protein
VLSPRVCESRPIDHGSSSRVFEWRKRLFLTGADVDSVPGFRGGHASSLVSHQGLLFVQYDQETDSKLLAFDLASGEPAWQVKRDVISWSSPILGDNRDAGLSAIDIGGHDAQPKVLWRSDAALPDAASPLAKDGYVIVPTGFGVVSCLDAKTGKLLWEKEFDRDFWSSRVLAKGRVYLIDSHGGMQVFRLGDAFELLGASGIGEADYATPAIVGGRIYIRGLTHLICVAARPALAVEEDDGEAVPGLYGQHPAVQGTRPDAPQGETSARPLRAGLEGQGPLLLSPDPLPPAGWLVWSSLAGSTSRGIRERRRCTRSCATT